MLSSFPERWIRDQNESQGIAKESLEPKIIVSLLLLKKFPVALQPKGNLGHLWQLKCIWLSHVLKNLVFL